MNNPKTAPGVIDTIGIGSVIHAATEVVLAKGIPPEQWPPSIVKYATERMLETQAPPPQTSNVVRLTRPTRSLRDVLAEHDLVGDALPHDNHDSHDNHDAVTDQSPGQGEVAEQDETAASEAIAWATGIRAGSSQSTHQPTNPPTHQLAVDPQASSRVLDWIQDRAAEAHGQQSSALRPGTEKGLKALADVFHDAVHHRLATEADAMRVYRATVAATGGWPMNDPQVLITWQDRATYLDNALARNVGRRTMLWLRVHAAVMLGKGAYDPDLAVPVPVTPEVHLGLVLSENRPRKGRGNIVWADLGEKGGPKPTPGNTEAWLTFKGLSLSYDEFSDRYYIHGHPAAGDTTDLTDRVMELLWLSACAAGLHVSQRTWKDQLVAISSRNVFDSLIDEVRTHVWDERPRLDTWVIDVLGVEDTPLNRAIGRKWMVGAVTRALHPGSKFDNVLVLEGKEGIGKSSVFAVLAGPGRFSDGLDIAGDPKRLIEESQGVWIGELAELAALSRHDAERTTASITKARDVARKAYDRMLSRVPRRFVLGGTTNESAEYLLTQQGNRRYWPLAVTRVDLGKLYRMRGQLIAEAAVAVDAGEKPALPAERVSEASSVQETKRTTDVWDDMLSRALSNAPPGTYIRVSDTLGIIGKDGGSTTMGVARRMTASMKRIGWRRHRIVVVQGKDAPHVFTNIPEGHACGRQDHDYVYTMDRFVTRQDDDAARERVRAQIVGKGKTGTLAAVK